MRASLFFCIATISYYYNVWILLVLCLLRAKSINIGIEWSESDSEPYLFIFEAAASYIYMISILFARHSCKLDIALRIWVQNISHMQKWKQYLQWVISLNCSARLVSLGCTWVFNEDWAVCWQWQWQRQCTTEDNTVAVESNHSKWEEVYK